jgi:hypothetical protein
MTTVQEDRSQTMSLSPLNSHLGLIKTHTKRLLVQKCAMERIFLYPLQTLLACSCQISFLGERGNGGSKSGGKKSWTKELTAN